MMLAAVHTPSHMVGPVSVLQGMHAYDACMVGVAAAAELAIAVNAEHKFTVQIPTN